MIEGADVLTYDTSSPMGKQPHTYDTPSPMCKQRQGTIGTTFGNRTFAYASSLYTEMVLFFWEHQSSPLKRFCREAGLEDKCYHSLRRVIFSNPILACLMRNQPDSGFT